MRSIPTLRPDGHIMHDQALMVGFDVAGYTSHSDIESLVRLHKDVYTAAEDMARQMSGGEGNYAVLERGGTGVCILLGGVAADAVVHTAVPTFVSKANQHRGDASSDDYLRMRTVVHRGLLAQMIHRSSEGAVLPEWGWLGNDLTQAFRILASQEYRAYHHAQQGAGVIALSASIAVGLGHMPQAAEQLTIGHKETRAEVYVSPLGL